MNTPWVDDAGNEIDEEDRGLVYDLQTMSRRGALGLFGGLGLAGVLAACSNSARTTAATTDVSTSAATSAATSATADATGPVTEVPSETGGPYPGDGSNGADILDDNGIVRSDIRSSFGSSTTMAAGVPLTVRLTVRDKSTGAAMKNAAVYLWHCDRDGLYSLYTKPDENYLRGIQQTDSTGTVTFTSTYPGCYDGRWPHIHFEVYDSVAHATSSGPIVKTSQIALPQEACAAVYATAGYEKSVTNLSHTSLTTDMVFRDDAAIHQLASMSGDTKAGYTASLTIGV